MNHAYRRMPAATFLGVCCAARAHADVPVQVIVDMDAQTPGIQSSITVPACTTVVHNIAVYIRDPLQTRTMYSIGYLGGIDRGISFGHSPSNQNHGSVSAVSAVAGCAVNPGNTPYILVPYMPGFAGAEIQYAEWGANAPSVIAAQPSCPIFTVDVSLNNARAGDRFRFHLLDLVTVWSGGGHGAFSTTGPLNTLDTGGDSVPDGTIAISGVDPDAGISVPPAAFSVDYIDGPVNFPPGGGGALIIIGGGQIPGDVTGDCHVNVDDLLAAINAWGPCPNCRVTPCPADLNHDCTINVDDLLAVINHWG